MPKIRAVFGFIDGCLNIDSLSFLLRVCFIAKKVRALPLQQPVRIKNYKVKKSITIKLNAV